MTYDDFVLDIELVSYKMKNFKRGKAADIFGISLGHLLFSHFILSIILSKLF